MMRSSYTFILFALALAFAGCTTDPNSPGLEYMPDMYRSPAIEAYVDYGMDPYHYGEEQYDSLNSRMSARKPVPGTIAYAGNMMAYNMPYPYENTPDGYELAGVELVSPLATTKDNIERGKEIYEIMCIHCHGEAGEGNGAISTNGHIKGIPSYSGKLADLPEGKMYHSITYGKGLMGSHASQINQLERWQVIQYVQVLQNGGSMPDFDDNGNVMNAADGEAEASDANAADTEMTTEEASM
jgi:mono/diheme cytochrome c family protein